MSDSGLTALCLKYRDSLFSQGEEAPAKVVTQSGKVASLKLLPLTSEKEKLKRYQRVLDKTRWSGLDGDLVGRGRLRSQLDLQEKPKASASAKGERLEQRKPWGAALVKSKRPQSAGGAFQGGKMGCVVQFHFLGGEGWTFGTNASKFGVKHLKLMNMFCPA